MKNEVLVLEGRASQAAEEAPRITVSLPETFQEASDVWGPEVAEKVFANGVKDAFTRYAKSRYAKGAGTAPEELEQAMVGWQPGMRFSRGGQSAPAKVSRTLKSLAKLSNDELAALREKLAEDPRFAVALQDG